jgi:hypothetical protein
MGKEGGMTTKRSDLEVSDGDVIILSRPVAMKVVKRMRDKVRVDIENDVIRLTLRSVEHQSRFGWKEENKI